MSCLFWPCAHALYPVFRVRPFDGSSSFGANDFSPVRRHRRARCVHACSERLSLLLLLLMLRLLCAVIEAFVLTRKFVSPSFGRAWRFVNLKYLQSIYGDTAAVIIHVHVCRMHIFISGIVTFYLSVLHRSSNFINNKYVVLPGHSCVL